MALKEELESSGNWLFRRRGYLPLAVIGLYVWALRDYQYPLHSERLDHMLEIVCVLISFLGMGIRVLTIAHTPKGTSGRNTRQQVADTLNTTGLYSVVRNPLYLGNFFVGLGVALFAHLWSVLLIYVLLFWLYYERIIFAEEAFLRDKLGDEFLHWAKRTPAFVPKLGLYRKAALPFSLKNVLRREYNGFFAIIVVMFLLDNVGEWFAEGVWDVDFWWLVFLGVGLVIWLTLRTLKKHTALLDVEGR